MFINSSSFSLHFISRCCLSCQKPKVFRTLHSFQLLRLCWPVLVTVGAPQKPSEMDCFPDAGDRCVDVCLKHFSIQRKPQARTVRRFTDQSPVVNCHHNDAKNPQPGAISAAQAQRKVDRWSWYLMGAHGDHLRTPPPPQQGAGHPTRSPRGYRSLCGKCAVTLSA